MLSKHTPGPWFVPKGGCFCVDYRAPDMDPSDSNFRIAKTYASPFSPDQEQSAANALLIAAAPDLLDAGWALSTWAGAIMWEDTATNTREWLDGLRARIDRFQAIARAAEQ